MSCLKSVLQFAGMILVLANIGWGVFQGEGWMVEGVLLILGGLVIVRTALGVNQGSLDMNEQMVNRSNKPVEFWLAIVLHAVLGLVVIGGALLHRFG